MWVVGRVMIPEYQPDKVSEKSIQAEGTAGAKALGCLV